MAENVCLLLSVFFSPGTGCTSTVIGTAWPVGGVFLTGMLPLLVWPRAIESMRPSRFWALPPRPMVTLTVTPVSSFSPWLITWTWKARSALAVTVAGGPGGRGWPPPRAVAGARPWGAGGGGGGPPPPPPPPRAAARAAPGGPHTGGAAGPAPRPLLTASTRSLTKLGSIHWTVGRNWLVGILTCPSRFSFLSCWARLVTNRRL